jgi:hypothetical protein
VVIPVIHWNSDDDWTFERQRFFKRGRHFVGMVYVQPGGTEGLGHLHKIHRPEIDAGRTPVLGYLLKADHVIVTVNPHQMNQITFEPDRGLEFYPGEKETSVS